MEWQSLSYVNSTSLLGSNSWTLARPQRGVTRKGCGVHVSFVSSTLWLSLVRQGSVVGRRRRYWNSVIVNENVEVRYCPRHHPKYIDCVFVCKTLFLEIQYEFLSYYSSFRWRDPSATDYRVALVSDRYWSVEDIQSVSFIETDDTLGWILLQQSKVAIPRSALKGGEGGRRRCS